MTDSLLSCVCVERRQCQRWQFVASCRWGRQGIQYIGQYHDWWRKQWRRDQSSDEVIPSLIYCPQHFVYSIFSLLISRHSVCLYVFLFLVQNCSLFCSTSATKMLSTKYTHMCKKLSSSKISVASSQMVDLLSSTSMLFCVSSHFLKVELMHFLCIFLLIMCFQALHCYACSLFLARRLCFAEYLYSVHVLSLSRQAWMEVDVTCKVKVHKGQEMVLHVDNSHYAKEL